MKKAILSVVVLLIIAITAQAQNITVHGTVISAGDGEPLIGATVLSEANGSIGTATDLDGKFTITVAEGSNLLISYVGYQKRSVKAEPELKISLSEDAALLDELVVVGYQTVRKADLTGAVSVMDMNEPMSENSGNIMNSMAGKLPGVNVIPEAAPGGTGSIRVRGMSTANSSNYGQGDTWTWTNTANYSKVFSDKHHLNVLLGTETIAYTFRNLMGSREGYAFEDVDYMELDAGTGYRNNGGNKSQWSVFSMFAKADYNYADRYLVSFTIRRDENSRFSKKHRAGVFPAASVAWRPSMEPFFPKNDIVNDLKIRYSWGQNGNANIPPLYPAYSTYIFNTGNGAYDLNGTNSSTVSGITLLSSKRLTIMPPRAEPHRDALFIAILTATEKSTTMTAVSLVILTRIFPWVSTLLSNIKDSASICSSPATSVLISSII